MRRTAVPKNPLTRKANAAMQDAVAKVVERHRREGRPLAVWQDGKAVLVPPGELYPDSEVGASLVRERPAAYKTRRHQRRPPANLNRR